VAKVLDISVLTSPFLDFRFYIEVMMYSLFDSTWERPKEENKLKYFDAITGLATNWFWSVVFM
jgi:hypothetical protein